MAGSEEVVPAKIVELTDEQVEEVAGAGFPVIGTAIGLAVGASNAVGTVAGGENTNPLNTVETDPKILEGIAAGGG